MKTMTIFLIIVFLGYSLVIIHANAQTPETNFTIVIQTNEGNPRREAYASYLATVLPFLGINVELRFIPFNQFIGDLLFANPKPYGISIIGCSDDSRIAPNFFERYHSLGFWGDFVYQLSSPEWKAWLPQDPGSGGITQDDVDSLIDNISSSFAFDQRRNLTYQFQQMFMEQLLYDIPLLAHTNLLSIWRGLDNFDPKEGTLRSAFLGATWGSETPAERKNNASTISEPLLSVTGKFDPLQVSDAETRTVLEGLFPQLLMFSKSDYTPHPWLAREFNWTTWYNAPNPDTMIGGTIDIPYGRMDFYLYDNWLWRYPNGTIFGPVTADDVKFTFDVMRANHTLVIGQSKLDWIDHIEVNATENRVSFFVSRPTIEDLYHFGTVQLIPYGLLGGDLTFANGTVIRALENTSAPLAFWQYNPLETQEWDAFETNPVQAGPYYIDFSDPNQYSPGQHVYKWANPQFTFPNEWDSSNFDQRTPEAEDAYFFTWADDPNTATHEKPTEMTISQFSYSISSDINNQLLLFKSGEVDILFPSLFGTAEVKAQLDNPLIDLHALPTTTTADLLIFNLLDPNLKKYNVRRAIAHMVDKESLNHITMNLYDPQDSPVTPFFKNNYYTDQWKISFDFEAAKTLMRAEGYVVPDGAPLFPVLSSVDIVGGMDDTLHLGGSYVAPPQPEVVETYGMAPDAWIFSLFAGIAILPILKRKIAISKY